MSDQSVLFADAFLSKNEKNPCIKIYGKGPEGERCKNCIQLYRKRWGGDTVYMKCKLRGDTNGPGTDHRANYFACAKFEKADEE